MIKIVQREHRHKLYEFIEKLFHLLRIPIKIKTNDDDTIIQEYSFVFSSHIYPFSVDFQSCANHFI